MDEYHSHVEASKNWDTILRPYESVNDSPEIEYIFTIDVRTRTNLNKPA